MPLLKDSNPELLTELILGKNEHLDLNSLNTNSSKKAWWQCSKNKSHQWESIVSGRAVKGYGCPFCSGLKTLRQDSFAALHAKLLAEWHPTKNDGIDPWSISAQSNKDAWWRCGNDPKHEWTTTVKHRVIYGSGCRQCLNIRSPLSVARPDIAREWHPTKNLPLTPDQVSTGSKKRVWWRCSLDPAHEWETAIGSRISAKSGCPHCARSQPQKNYPSLEEFNPDLAEQLHPTKNENLSAALKLPASSHQKLWWKCRIDVTHVWQTNVRSRALLGRGCPYCGQRTRFVTPATSLAGLFPELAKEWHPTKNEGISPSEVAPGSSKRAWWQCQAKPEHVWDAVIYGRTGRRSNKRCPFCSGARISKSNSLAECHPDVAKEWHPNKNEPLTPALVKRASGKNVWWQCADDAEHEWQAIVKNRTVLGSSCPHCAGKNGARRLQEHLLEAALLNKDSYQIFSESMGNLNTLAKIPFSGHSRSKHLFNRMLYSSAITTLETYLSDAFCQNVIHDEKLRIRLLKSSPDMKDRKFGIDDVLQWNGRIDEMVSQYLLDIVWHNLAKIRPMFADVLSIQFPTDSASVHRAVATRHDIVHRNGRRKDGSVLVIRDTDLMSCFDAVSSFAEHIENQLKSRN